MSKLINLAFVFHFHQPHGQLKYVFENILKKCYFRLLKLFEEFENLRFGVHISGPLLEMLKSEHREFIDDTKHLAQAGTIELIGGSFSEAILPIIPWRYIPDQIRYFQRLISELFGCKVRGFWLPERVWEPYLVKFLSSQQVDYVILDDQHFLLSGRKREDSLYAYTIEEDGRTIKAVFADTKIRYLVPWHSPKEAFNYVKSKSSENGDRLLLIVSDAEKFGEWTSPDWAEKWLREFFSYVLSDSSIAMVTPSDYLDEHGVRGLTYIPSASYDKMLEWSGGYFKNFFLKYVEANLMHKKMLRVGKLLEENLSDEALTFYLRGQCNDAYWHGLFGGIYLTNLRQAVYENLIKAERIAFKGKGRVEVLDFDLDGLREILIEDKYLNVYIKPSDGGSVFEYDIKLENYEHNLANVMSRYSESYLTDMRADWHRRTLFREHIFSKDVTSKQWIENAPFLDLSDLSLASYCLDEVENNRVCLSYRGKYRVKDRTYYLIVKKKYEVRDLDLLVDYRIQNLTKNIDGLNFGIELCLSPYLPYGEEKTPTYAVGGIVNSIFESLEKENAESFILQAVKDLYLKITWSPKCRLWIEPIYAKARTERGVVVIPEGLALMTMYQLVDNLDVTFKLSLMEKRD